MRSKSVFVKRNFITAVIGRRMNGRPMQETAMDVPSARQGFEDEGTRRLPLHGGIDDLN